MEDKGRLQNMIFTEGNIEYADHVMNVIKTIKINKIIDLACPSLRKVDRKCIHGATFVLQRNTKRVRGSQDIRN